MATHRLWCGHGDCGELFYSIDNDRPILCPKCTRIQRWTATPPYKLSFGDKKFLRGLRITRDEGAPEVEDDGA